MKNLSFLDKILFLINSLLAVGLLFGYALPYISPKLLPTIAILNLGVPVLIMSNLLFLVYWIVKIKKQFTVSLLILGIGYQHLLACINFSEKKVPSENDLTVMTYNVRLFNAYKWTTKDSVDYKIYDFVTAQKPDIVTFQEYYPKKNITIKYPYKYIAENKYGTAARQAIYSNYKIINKGSLNFRKTGNNAIFADIIKGNDTIRIYNIHLQSLSIDKNKENFGEKDSEKLITRFENTFSKQADQVKQILQHQKKSPYRNIFMGDFNNTAFSWVYKQLSAHKKDAFIEAGSGFGKSFDYFFPFRIDFILVDESITVNYYKTHSIKHSDHYPVMTRLNITD